MKTAMVLKRLFVVVALAGLTGCHFRSARSEERFFQGTWEMVKFLGPREASGMPADDLYAVKSLMRKKFELGPIWQKWPVESLVMPCMVEGSYQLVPRRLRDVAFFDLRNPLAFNAAAAGFKHEECFEIQSQCRLEAYLNWNRTRIVIPYRGFLLVLEPPRHSSKAVATPTPFVLSPN